MTLPRYTHTDTHMEPDTTGQWVRAEDAEAENARLRADLANAGAVMVEAALRLPAYDSDGDPAGQFDHHVFVRRDDLRAISTISPIAAAARVCLSSLGDYDRDRSHPAFVAAMIGQRDSNKPAPFNQIGDGFIAGLRALAEQENADG